MVDNCCCANVGDFDCSSDTNKCGTSPETKEMDGEDAVVLCGEWEIGEFSQEESGEEYNIVLPIIEIRRHPDYQIVRGDRNSQYVENDIAIIKVDDNVLNEPLMNEKINPACLPSGNHSLLRKIVSQF